MRLKSTCKGSAADMMGFPPGKTVDGFSQGILMGGAEGANTFDASFLDADPYLS